MSLDEALELVLDIDDKRQRKERPYSKWSKPEKEASDLIGRLHVFGVRYGKKAGNA